MPIDPHLHDDYKLVFQLLRVWKNASIYFSILGTRWHLLKWVNFLWNVVGIVLIWHLKKLDHVAIVRFFFILFSNFWSMSLSLSYFKTGFWKKEYGTISVFLCTIWPRHRKVLFILHDTYNTNLGSYATGESQSLVAVRYILPVAHSLDKFSWNSSLVYLNR